MSGFGDSGIDRLRTAIGELTPTGAPGLAWAVAIGDEVHTGTAGVGSVASARRVTSDSVFRIASLTKPILAAATLAATEAGTLALDDPVDRWLPELDHPRVLRRQEGPLDDTVACQRAITVRDLLAFTAGYGFDFANFDRQTQVGELVRLELGVGPPAPAHGPGPDEWMRRLATIPLDHQPGAAWRYHFGSEILGVLLARAEGRPLDTVFSTYVLDPLGMGDTAFWAHRSDLSARMTTSYAWDSESGERTVYDDGDAQWSAPPVFLSGGGGLISTVDDYLRFGRALLAGGGPVLSAASVAAMTTDHLTSLGASIAPDDDIGWGFGVDVKRQAGTDARSPGSYGWAGGLGTLWWNDPSHDLVAVLFTNQALDGPSGAAYIDTFRDAVYAAVG